MSAAASPSRLCPGSGTRACWLSSRKPIFSLICGASRAEVPSSSPCSPPSFCSLCCSSCSAGSTASATAAGMAATAPCPFPRWYTGPSSGGTGPAAGGTGGGTRRLLRPRPAGAPEVQAPVPPWAADRVLLWAAVTVRPGPRRPAREAAALVGEAVSAEVLPEAEDSAAAEALEAVPEAEAVSEVAPGAAASEEAREAEAASGAVPGAEASEAAHAAEAASGAVPEAAASAEAGDKAKNIPGGRPVRRGFVVDAVEKKQTVSAMSAGHGQR